MKKKGLGVLINPENRAYMAGYFTNNKLIGLTIKSNGKDITIGNTENNKFVQNKSPDDSIYKSKEYKSMLEFAQKQVSNTENEEKI